MSEFVPVGESKGTRVGGFLCWPAYDEDVFDARLVQLKELGVESVALGGPHTILTKPVLGKGHVGMVIRAMFDGVEVALKCRRTDAPGSMEHEAHILDKANEAGLGPMLYSFSDDFMVMEKLEGPYFGDWTKENMSDPALISDYVGRIIDIAYRLDDAGIDHGELTKIRRHFIVTDGGPRVIDFDSGSLGRTPRNLTCTVQSLFMHTTFSKVLAKVYPMPDRAELLAALRVYKESPGEESYKNLLKVMR
jgi:putative serine/threonine protein kinase